MRSLTTIAALALTLVLCGCGRTPHPGQAPAPQSAPGDVVGIHILSYTSDSLLVELGKVVPDLAARGVNLIVLEVDYSFAFQSHPELRAGGQVITRDGARALAAICRRHGIRLVPQFQSLGHQSWAAHTGPLLTVYPELDITPGAFPNNEGLYCREWDPTNPRVNEIVFPLIDEIVDAFEVDAVHVGMDEVFLLAADASPTTRGKAPAKLFARVVNEFHDHFVKERGLEMFMWADRFIDATAHGYGSWEASTNGTWPAIDMVPKDIVMCDWHYAAMEAYTSVPMFADKGFRVLPSSWRDLDAVKDLIKYSYGLQRPEMMGHLFTTWGRLPAPELVDYTPLITGVETIRGGRYYDVTFELQSVSSGGALEVSLAAPIVGLDIHYTTDGGEPTMASPRYAGALRLDHSATVRAIATRGDEAVSDVTQKDFVVHLATGKAVALTTPPSPKYPPRDGVGALVNGMLGSDSYADGQWVGLEGPDLEAVIDLGAPTTVRSVRVTSLRDRGAWVHPSPRVEVFGSHDGVIFAKLGEAAEPEGAGGQRRRRAASEDADVTPDEGGGGPPARRAIVPLEVTFASTAVRFLKVIAHNRLIPEGNEGAGTPAWLFVDEIIVQ